MNFAKLAKDVEKFTIDNSPSILTAIGATGTLATAYLTAKASFRAARLIEDKKFVQHLHEPKIAQREQEMDTKAKVKLVWTCYIPPTVAGVGTIAAIIGANQIQNRRAAAMAAAYSLSQHAFEEYREKVVEKLGKTKEQTARDEIAQEHVNRNPVGKNQVIVTGGGEVLCYDKYTGRYFHSSMETLKKSENDINFYILNNDYANLNDFYRLIGLPLVPVGEEVGWTPEFNFEILFSTTMSENDKPCIAIDYQVCGVRKRPSSQGLKAVNRD